jgi:hypothetical protein
MKQFYLFLVLGLCILNNTEAQAPRRVLVEEFTQASCPPCAVYNPIFHGVIFTPGNESKVSLLCYQVNWPGSDPMNLQNPTEVASRVSYYGINAVPDCLADGGVTESGNPIYHGNIADFKQPVIDNRAAVSSPFELTVSHDVHVKLDSVTVNLTVKNVSANEMPDVYTLQTALIEKTIEFHIPPGTNGELEFVSVMRKMIPNVTGTKLGVLAAGASVSFNYTIAIPGYIYALRNLGVISFIQNIAKKEIMQSAESYPKPLPSGSSFLDLRIEAAVNGYTDLCDPNVSFKVDFFNDGTDSVKTVSIDLMLNGVKQTGQTALALNLPGGAMGTYEFRNVNLKTGKNTMNFRINNINGVANNKDVDKLNHTGSNKILFNVASAPYATEMHEGYVVAARGQFPANLHVDNSSSMSVFPADKGYFNAVDNIGGFGQSPFSLFWDFYYGPGNTEVKLFYNKLDLSNSTNTHLMLSRAYAQLRNKAARFTIEASDNCGRTWTTVYEKEGSELATVPPLATTYFTPRANQWKRDTVSMTSFDGAAEVIIRLRGYNPADGSNLMFIDDIDIAPLSPVSTEDPGVLGQLEVFPNPVKGIFQLSIESLEAVSTSVQLFDMNGKSVGILADKLALKAGKNLHTFKVQTVHSGLYTLKLISEKGTRNLKISIIN